MASLFDTLQAGAYRANIVPRSNKARSWFRKAVKELGTVSRTKVMKDPILDVRTKPRVGDMCMYVYDPKFKKTLPYYDTFPLIFMVGAAEGGFYGINLHYLPPKLRAKLMDELYSLASNNRYDEKTKLMISYNLLKSASKMKYFKPTFKHYLADHVKSKFIKVDSAEWDIALFLPTSRFKHATTQKVYSDSRKKF